MRQDGLKAQQLGARECDTHQCSVEVAAGSLLWPVVVDPDLPNLDKEVPTVMHNFGQKESLRGAMKTALTGGMEAVAGGSALTGVSGKK
jgi:hypothetical protein